MVRPYGNGGTATKNIGVRVTPEQAKRLKKLAKLEKLNKSQLARQLIDQAWEAARQAGRVK